MNQDSTYVLDANVFIEAARRYYAFDLAPRFWEILSHYASIGQIQSIDKIREKELIHPVELVNWAERNLNAFASTAQDDVIRIYSNSMNWVQAQSQFSDAAKSEFAVAPDGWLIAYSKANGYIVVTHEVLNPNIKRKVPIPNVCRAFSVQYVDTFEMLRSLGVKFK